MARLPGRGRNRDLTMPADQTGVFTGLPVHHGQRPDDAALGIGRNHKLNGVPVNANRSWPGSVDWTTLKATPNDGAVKVLPQTNMLPMVAVPVDMSNATA